MIDKPVIPPKPVRVNDGGYRGAHPDDIDYPHEEVVSDGKRSLELKAFTTKGMEQLRRIATEQFLPLLESEGLNCALLCEKRRDSGRGGKLVLGVCFNPGRAAQERGERQAIMLRHPDADDPRVAYTTLHEATHLREDNHFAVDGFGAEFGRIVSRAVGDGTPFSHWRLDLLALAKGDSYAPPIPPQGTWDDYFNGAPAIDPYAVSPNQLGLDSVATEPAAALTVDAGWGVVDWGFDPQLLPERAARIDIDRERLVGAFLEDHPEVLADTGSGGFQWDTGRMGETLSKLYARELTERGVGQNSIPLITRSMDFKAAVKSDLESIEPVLDAEVRRRREQDGEVPF